MVRSASANFVQTFGIASVIGLLLVSPLAILEFQYATVSRQSSDYAALFGLLWLLIVAIVVVAVLTVRSFKPGHTMLSKLRVLGIEVILLVFMAGTWITIVKDQFPCFIGVANCD